MSRALVLLTAIALTCGVTTAQQYAPWDAGFWGPAIGTLTRDTLGVPESVVWEGDFAANMWYAEIPLSVLQNWVANPAENHGIAVIGRVHNGGDTNNCWSTYKHDWVWHAKPHLQMDGWMGIPDQMAWIQQGNPTFSNTPTMDDAWQFCTGENTSVVMIKWSDLQSGPGSPDSGLTRWLRWGAPYWNVADVVFDIYLAPAYWDEWDITYGGYVTGGGTTYLPGDANQDGVVNTDDLGILLANWGQSGVWTSGDFNEDGVVNTDDLGLLLGNWGQSSVVPEPATLALLGLGGLGLIRRRR